MAGRPMAADGLAARLCETMLEMERRLRQEPHVGQEHPWVVDVLDTVTWAYKESEALATTHAHIIQQLHRGPQMPNVHLRRRMADTERLLGGRR